MTGRLLMLTCAIITGFSVVMAGLRVRAQQDEALRDMLGAPANCAPPCWQGIRPQVTTADEAEARLRAHPWVSDLIRGDGTLSWRWNGQQPGYIDAALRGIVYLRSERVETVRIPLRVTFGDIWALLGAPAEALLVRPVSRSTAYQIATYPEVGVGVISSLSCPMGPSVFWSSQTTLHLGSLTFSDLMNSSSYDVFTTPNWWRWLHTCRRRQAR